MSVRKMRGAWWVDFRSQFVRYRKKSPDNTRSGALAYEATLRGKLARGEDLYRAQRPPTLAEFSREWMTAYVCANNKVSEQATKESILRVHLVPYFGTTPLTELRADRVEAYKAAKLRHGLSRQSVNNHLNVLRKCLRTAVEWGLAGSVPVIRRLKASSSRIDYLTDEEVSQLLALPPSPWHAMALLALRTGLRWGELAGLHWEDIDLAAGILTVRRSLVRGVMDTTKSHRIRHIPLAPSARATIAAMRRASGHVFTADEGGPVTYASGVHHLGRLCRLAGVRRVTWHVLRHTFASHLAMKGVPILTIQKLLGHSTVAMTERYAHLAPSHLRDAVLLLDDPSSGGSWATGGQQVPSPAVLTRP